MKWPIPPIKDFNWKMKGLGSAKTHFKIDKAGVFHLHIEHDIIKGVTPEMLEWWFKNIGGTMYYQGKEYSRYCVWHPKDHIHWALLNPEERDEVGVGSKFHIVEAFNRNPKYGVNTIDTVQKLDKTGIILNYAPLGIEVFRLEHRFIEAPNGTQYISDMTVGSTHFLGRLFINWYLTRFIFTKKMGVAWLKHNIEEVGNFEFFLPELFYQEYEKTAPLSICLV